MCGRNIAEGFGLTVTEAMWKGAVLIGDWVVGAAMGSTSFLVDTATQAAARTVQFFRDRELRLALRRARPYGHAFLMSRLMEDWLDSTLEASFHLTGDPVLERGR